MAKTVRDVLLDNLGELLVRSVNNPTANALWVFTPNEETTNDDLVKLHAAQQTNYLRSIKKMLVFFTVLTSIGIGVGVIWLLSLLM